MGLIKQLFYRGQYTEVLQKTFLQPPGAVSDAAPDVSSVSIEEGHIIYVVGSLSFLGRIREAEAVCRAQFKELSDLQKSYCYFFLGLGYTRRSQYDVAKKYFLRNRALQKRTQATGRKNDFEIQFLVQQGISFFLFFLGKFEKSIAWSERALSSAIAAQDVWQRALAHDLLANNLIQNGRIHEALKHFDQALAESEYLKNSALVGAIRISKLVFSCEYGIQLNQSYEQLKKTYLTADLKDGFSRANLGLEYARQLTLRGDFSEAIQVLNDISSFIFQSQNRRQEARYNLRWAELNFLKSEAHSSLHFIRSGRRCLEFVDYTYEMQFLGLEKKVYEELLQQPVPESLTARLLQLSATFNNIKNNNILSRDQMMAAPVSGIIETDDEIHARLSKAEKSPAYAREVILETRYFSWLHRFFKLKRNERYVLLNLEPKSITFITANGIFHRPNELSTLNYKILNVLSKGFTTKEELVKQVWGYNYDPLRHDSLIYSTFSSLRKIFIPDTQMIETSEMGYGLQAKLVNLLENRTKPVEAARESFINPDYDISKLITHDLNARQIQIVQFLDQNQFVSVRQVMKIFDTSEITANRDLRSLFQKKLVLRVGQGRSTQYTKMR